MMKLSSPNRPSAFTLLSLGLALTAVTAHADVLFSEDFGGTADDLNETAPDVRPGAETWVATPIFNQDGSLDPDAGSATLAFTPTDGKIYQLDVSLSGVSGDQNWIALGFGTGQSAAPGTNNRFINGNLIGKVWMLFRGNTNGHQAFLGNATSGTAVGSPWTALDTATGAIDMRIELDTTGGAGAWAATWFAKRPTDASYTEVRAKATLLDESINSVGIALARNLVDGMIESFSLSTCPGTPAKFAITAVDYAPADSMVTLTWDSREGEQYAVKFSTDLSNWDGELDDGVEADPGETTTRTFPLGGFVPEGGKLFFRVEKP